MKTLLSFTLLFITLTTFAQQNILLDRNFWNQDPDLETVKKHIDAGNDATAFNANGFDATTFALLSKTNNETIKFLLSLKGNEIDKRTHDSRIYLHWASMGGDFENIKTLLEMGSAVDAKDSRGSTPLIFAAASGLTNSKIYELFAQHGVKLENEVNPQGANLLLLAAPFYKDLSEANFLIKNGIDLKSTDNNGNGIFNYASRRGNIQLLKELIEQDVDFKTLSKNGENAFIFASQGTRGFSNSIEIYQFLQELGLNPNVVTKDGTTPLHRIAATKAKPEILNLFLEAGVNPDQADAEGNTPVLNASSRGDIDNLVLLSKSSKNFATTTNKKGQSALMLALANNTPDVVSFLLENKADVNSKDVDGNSVIYYLAQSFNPKKQEEFEKKLVLLKDNGAKLAEVQAEGNTPFHLAAASGYEALVTLLNTSEIKIDTVNDEGLTPLHLAAMKAKDPKILMTLVSLGADTQATTEFGETAHDLALENELLKGFEKELDFLN